MNGKPLQETEIDWLLDEFRREPTACRAAILAAFIVLNMEDHKIATELLKGTRASTWL